jgi:alkanesulfonate monooxygenase SsuD/methylene tetrahydromethanopterin reductase-like flavin-dependent oxidoreductase (luciferase family)
MGLRAHTGGVDVGLAFPQMTPDLDRDRIRAWCRAVDDGPFSSISAGERIAFDNLDAFTLCSAAAALTDRVRVLFNVIVAPWHHPAMLAKQTLSIDALSGGRVEVALGVGGREQDYEALGSSTAGRFGRLDRAATELRRIWAGGEVVPGAGVGPTSAQPGGPRLLCSGTGPKSLARASAWADGLTHFPLGADPAEAGRAFDLATTAWADAGRADVPRKLTGSFVVLGPDAEARLHAFARRYLDVFGTDIAAWLTEQMPLHTDQALHDFLVGLREVGCDEVVLVPGSSDPDQVGRIADVVASIG